MFNRKGRREGEEIARDKPETFSRNRCADCLVEAFTWFGEYRVGGAWIPIGTLDLTTSILYDVDEVVGVLVDP